MSRKRAVWIEQTNPLRGLNPARVVGLLEAGMRGELAELMWLYHIIEQSDPDLMALVERRASAIAEMDWNIGVAPEGGRQNAEGRKQNAEIQIQNRWVTIGGRPVLVDEEGDQENPHTPEQQAAEIGKGLAAMRRVLAEKGDAVGAVARGDIGPVSFYWGEEGDAARGYRKGYGISHIVAKHGVGVAEKIPEILVRGKISGTYQDGQKRNVTHGPYTATLSLIKRGKNEAWVLTGFDSREAKK